MFVKSDSCRSFFFSIFAVFLISGGIHKSKLYAQYALALECIHDVGFC